MHILYTYVPTNWRLWSGNVLYWATSYIVVNMVWHTLFVAYYSSHSLKHTDKLGLYTLY